MSVSLVIVSHSAQLAKGVVELADQMIPGKVKLADAGGGEGDILGTSVEKIYAAPSRPTVKKASRPNPEPAIVA